MKSYDVNITSAQLHAAAGWVHEDLSMDVQLLVDDRMLVVGQGDAKTAFDTGGEVGSDEYIALAPLERHERNEQLALWFTPQAIREHFDGDDAVDLEGVSNDALAAAAQDELGGDVLYRDFHHACQRIVGEATGGEA